MISNNLQKQTLKREVPPDALARELVLQAAALQHLGESERAPAVRHEALVPGFPGRRDRVDVVAPQVRQRRRVVERRAPRGVDGAAERRRELVRRAHAAG